MRGDPTYTQYDMSERGEEKKYPNWKDAAPNLQTFLTALNQSQPIVQCQYELVWSRWPRTIFFAKNITIPGVSVQTQDISHAGFTIKIPTHVTYETTEITINIIADKEGFHYYDLRNMVMQTGHPLVAGDPRATIGNPYGLSPDEDTLEVRLRNRPEDETHHHWILHNFHPIGIGDLELTQDGSGFVEFELKGTITHVTYDCGKQLPEQATISPPEESQSNWQDNDVQVEVEFPEDEDEEEDEGEEDQEDQEDEGDEDDWEDDEDEDEDDWDSEMHEDIESESTDIDSDSEIDIDVQEDDNGEIPPEDQSLADTLDEKLSENVDNLNTDLQNIADGDEDTLLDDDAKAAKQILEETGGDREQAKEQLTEKILSENPDMDSDEAELTAEQALRDAEDFKQIHSQENEGQGGETNSGEEQQPPSPPKTIDENVSIKEDTPREGQDAKAHSDYVVMDDDAKNAVNVLKECDGNVGDAEDKMYEKIQKENPWMDPDDVRNAAEMAVLKAQAYTEEHGSEPPKPVDTVQVETKVEGTTQTDLQKNATHEAVQDYKEKTEQTIDAYKDAKQNIPLEGHSAEALELFNQHQGDRIKVEEAIQEKIQRENPDMDSDAVQEEVDIAMLKAEFEYSKQKSRKAQVLAARGQLKRKGNVLKTTQLTLPHRFGMVKTPTRGVPKTTQIELDDPPFNSEPRKVNNPSHKVRGIFG